MRHPLAWATFTLLAACAIAALRSPVVVRLRVKVRGCILARPRLDVQLLWGLVRLRPQIAVPRQPLREVARRLGLPVEPPVGRSSGGAQAHAVRGGRSDPARPRGGQSGNGPARGRGSDWGSGPEQGSGPRAAQSVRMQRGAATDAGGAAEAAEGVGPGARAPVDGDSAANTPPAGDGPAAGAGGVSRGQAAPPPPCGGRPGAAGRRRPPSSHPATARPAGSGAAPVHRALFAALRTGAVRRLRLRVALQTGDPARTAIAAGAAWGVLGAALAALPAYVRFEAPPRLDVQPRFSGPTALLADVDCILAARLGHVMVAALRSWLAGG